MKKFIAMVMTAAMVASLVPATAFAGDSISATANVVNKWTLRDSEGLGVDNYTTMPSKSAPEVQLTITDAGVQGTNPGAAYEFTVELDGADFDYDNSGSLEQAEIDALNAAITVQLASDGTVSAGGATYGWNYTAATQAQLKTALEGIYDVLKAGSGSFTSDVAVMTIATVDANSDGTAPDYADLNPVTFLTNTNITSYGLTAPADTTITAGSTTARTANLATLWGKYFADVLSSAGSYTYSNNIGVDQKEGYVDGLNVVYTADIVNYIKNAVVGDPGVTVTAGDKALLNAAGTDVIETVVADNPTKEAWVNSMVSKLDADPANAVNTLGFYVEDATYELVPSTVPSGAERAGLVTASIEATGWDADDTEKVTLTVRCGVDATSGKQVTLAKGDIIKMDLISLRDKAKDAFVAVKSDDISIANANEDMIYVDVADEGITAEVSKLATVAEEESTALAKDLVIKATVGEFAANQVIELKLNNGFEFVKAASSNTAAYTLNKIDDDIVELTVVAADDKIEVEADDIVIEATDAKAGATAVLTVKATNTVPNAWAARTTVEVMTVCEYTVIMSVDADEDVPVIYSGVNVANYGLTDDSDHLSLEVTVEETFPGAWSFRKGFNFELPEGVYVTDVTVKECENFIRTTSDAAAIAASMEDVFAKAYQDGDHVNFEFGKRVFDDVNYDLNDDEATMTFVLELVADPGFVGDVTLKLTGELVDEQEVVIANFATPYYVTAEQNDLKIDYRYTDIPTEIVITEAEAGLWDADKARFGFYMDKDDVITFEDDPIFTVNEESGMELDDAELGEYKDVVAAGTDKTPVIMAVVDKESDEAATVTISGMSLFMKRDIPAGPYDLKGVTSMAARYEAQPLFAPDCVDDLDGVCADSFNSKNAHDDKFDCYVGDVCDYSDVVKEAFVNVVTAGREQDDNSFTTVVKVPVGENVLYAGEVTVELDVPAYINANGYTMLPVRAVAKALGINNNNVLWDQATKTVTILYGQRIITMQVGANVVYVNGSAIPASSSVEIVDGRTFLGLRDLATALGVTTIDWDAASKTALLNAEFEA